MKYLKHAVATVVIVSSMNSMAMVSELKTTNHILNEFKQNLIEFLHKRDRGTLKRHASKFRLTVNKLSSLRMRLTWKFNKDRNKKYMMMLRVVDMIYDYALRINKILSKPPVFFISFIKNIKYVYDDISSEDTIDEFMERIENLIDFLDEEEIEELGNIYKVLNDIKQTLPKDKISLLKTVRCVWNR